MTQQEALQELINRNIITKFDDLKQENPHCDNKLQEYVRKYNETEPNSAEIFEIITLIVDTDPSLIVRENSNRHSALFDCILHNKVPVIDLFLAKNPNLVFYQDSRNETMMHYFARRGAYDKYTHQIAKNNPAALKTYNIFGFAPVHVAIDNSNQTFLDGLYAYRSGSLLLKTQTDPQKTCSELALLKKHDPKMSQWFHIIKPNVIAKIKERKEKLTAKAEKTK